jgi:PadR family transcriptional regulator, regulatory protein PadR
MKRERRSSPQTLCVLEALLARPRAWRHGYDLSLETELKSGTLYPVLMRLSDRGCLDSKWEESDIPGRPPRRLYRLTATGLAYARSEVVAHDELRTPGKPARGRA